jgi:hypothetical protein
MPLARGTAAVGYTTMLGLFWAAGMPITQPIPTDYQVRLQWHCFFSFVLHVCFHVCYASLCSNMPGLAWLWVDILFAYQRYVLFTLSCCSCIVWACQSCLPAAHHAAHPNILPGEAVSCCQHVTERDEHSNTSTPVDGINGVTSAGMPGVGYAAYHNKSGLFSAVPATHGVLLMVCCV